MVTSTKGRGRSSQPRLQVFEVTGTTPEKSDQESVRRICFGLDAPPVEPQEYVGSEEGYSFFAVHERVIHEQGFEQRSCHLDEVELVAGLGSVQRTFGKT